MSKLPTRNTLEPSPEATESVSLASGAIPVQPKYFTVPSSAALAANAPVTKADSSVEAQAAPAENSTPAAEAQSEPTENPTPAASETPAQAVPAASETPAPAVPAASVAAAPAPAPAQEPTQNEIEGLDWDDPSLANAAHMSKSSNETRKVVRKKKRHKKRKKRLKIVVLVLVILLVLVGAAYAGVSMMRHQGEESLHVDYTEGETVTYNGTTYQYNKNIVSICVMGYDRYDSGVTSDDEEPGQADAIAVLALDTQTGKTTAIVIPRESMVEVNTYAQGSFTGTSVKQICLAFAYGDGAETSAENVVTSVKRVLNNMPINYYVALNRQGIIPLNDAIGGVTLTSLEDVPDTDIKEGEEVTLLGSDAYYYVQRREWWGTQGTLDRMERQAQYIQEYAKQAIAQATKAGGLSVLTNLYSIGLDYTTTNLGASEFSYLASVLLDKGVTDINVVTLTGSIIQGESYAEFTLDSQNTYQVVLDTFYTPVETNEDN